MKGEKKSRVCTVIDYFASGRMLTTARVSNKHGIIENLRDPQPFFFEEFVENPKEQEADGGPDEFLPKKMEKIARRRSSGSHRPHSRMESDNLFVPIHAQWSGVIPKCKTYHTDHLSFRGVFCPLR
jgi:hypothetical protein